jgi:hypothetical protein
LKKQNERGVLRAIERHPGRESWSKKKKRTQIISIFGETTPKKKKKGGISQKVKIGATPKTNEWSPLFFWSRPTSLHIFRNRNFGRHQSIIRILLHAQKVPETNHQFSNKKSYKQNFFCYVQFGNISWEKKGVGRSQDR